MCHVLGSMVEQGISESYLYYLLIGSAASCYVDCHQISFTDGTEVTVLYSSGLTGFSDLLGLWKVFSLLLMQTVSF